MIRYSICITNFNMRSTLRPFLESILSQVDSEFEIVICDNFSDDGSREMLEDYARDGMIRLFFAHSSRGKGRQIAYENSKGQYIISGLDTDDVVKPTIRQVLKVYHDSHEGYVLSYRTIHFIPRHIVEAVGGWRDLQWGEDVDFCKRVEALGKMHYFKDDSLLISRRGHVNRSLIFKLREEYRICQSKYQIGLSLFGTHTTSWYYLPIQCLIALSVMIQFKLAKKQRFHYT
jgi:glycosyltransferase involved in cell wall biosynthesis